ncbi:MAG: LLM class F420-dependent oxidoreductase [Pseudomonadales bacterium]|nr:LLM class F420-dependent oxidoreductase [Pseudomonadales bacterium]MCP5186018.1 LLM class F420-dependent oxidoreductase [Pseudomonadales bacterium]
MKIGTFLSVMAPMHQPDSLRDLAQVIESAGLESLWLGEHVILFDEMEFPYPGSADGRLPVPEGQGIPDQASLIAWMASATRSLRFGTGISLISQRSAVYTAKEFATLDYLTGGRVDLGVGVGWCKEEVEACGFSWQDRGRRTDEALDLMVRLWTQPVVDFQGEFHTVRGGRMQPGTVQSPHIPLIIGGFSDAALARTARIGQGWLGFGLTPDMTAGMLRRLDRALETAGRTRAEIEIVMMPARDDADSVRAYAELGVDRLLPMFDPTMVSHPAERLRYLETLVRLAETLSERC